MQSKAPTGTSQKGTQNTSQSKPVQNTQKPAAQKTTTPATTQQKVQAPTQQKVQQPTQQKVQAVKANTSTQKQQVQVGKGVKQDEKKVVVEQIKKLSYDKEISLTAMLNILENLKVVDNKSAIVVDSENSAQTFFKYKGEQIDLTEELLREQMGKQTRQDTLENARKRLVIALKNGANFVINMDTAPKDLSEIFKDCAWWQPEKIFNPTEILQEEFYKKYIITQEEDVDYLGNKGGFQAKKDFNLSILLSLVQDGYDDIDSLAKKLGIPLNHFSFVKIVKQ